MYCGPSNKSVDVVAGTTVKLTITARFILREILKHNERRRFDLNTVLVITNVTDLYFTLENFTILLHK